MSGDPVFSGIADEAAPDLATQIAVLTELGWPAIELRTIDRIAIAELTDRQFGDVAETLSRSGLRVICLASRIGGWARPITTPFKHDLAEFDVLAKRCAQLGTRYVRIMSYPNDGLDEPQWRKLAINRIRMLARLAESTGLVLVHENCSGWAGTSGRRMLELLVEVDSPALKLLFDTGNGVAHGYDGHELLGEIVDHVAHVHIKDAVGDRYTVPGQGAARVADCVELLRTAGYGGAWSLEPHLAIRPHEPGELTKDAASVFVSAGRAMAELIR
jgi:sugar phosphate isomerase/epimerase